MPDDPRPDLRELRAHLKGLILFIVVALAIVLGLTFWLYRHLTHGAMVTPS